MLKRLCVLSGILFLLFSVSTFAAAPRLINFQGKLTTAQGTPETGSKDLTFKIYNVETSGTSLWQETVSGVILDSDGQFSTMLGLGGSPSNLSIDFSQPLWLQVIYNGQEFQPRQKLASVPYSFYAITAESLAGGITQEIINLTVNNNLTVSGTGDSTFTGSVGIGTTDATSKLTVAGTAEMTGFKMLTGAVSGYVLTVDINGVGTWLPATGGGGGGITQETDTLDSVLARNGVSSKDATVKNLTVAGTAEVTGFRMPTGANAGWVLMCDGNGNAFWALPPGGGFTTSEVFDSSGTFTVPAGVTSIQVEVWGGGGGGGNGSYYSGGGGGGGGYSKGTFSVNPGDIYTVTVGGGTNSFGLGMLILISGGGGDGGGGASWTNAGGGGAGGIGNVTNGGSGGGGGASGSSGGNGGNGGNGGGGGGGGSYSPGWYGGTGGVGSAPGGGGGGGGSSAGGNSVSGGSGDGGRVTVSY